LLVIPLQFLRFASKILVFRRLKVFDLKIIDVIWLCNICCDSFFAIYFLEVVVSYHNEPFPKADVILSVKIYERSLCKFRCFCVMNWLLQNYLNAPIPIRIHLYDLQVCLSVGVCVIARALSVLLRRLL